MIIWRTIDGLLSTSTFVKPLHSPQILHCLSEHSKHCVKGIFRSRCIRFLLNSDLESDYLAHAEKLKITLSNRMYPSHWLVVPGYDKLNRDRLLCKVRETRRKRKLSTMVGPMVENYDYSATVDAAADAPTTHIISLPNTIVFQTTFNQVSAKLPPISG